MKELQARLDAARQYHDIMTAQYHTQRESKFKVNSSADGIVCQDDEGNELHSQWTCHRCLARLDNHFDKLFHRAVLDQDWTEAQIHAGGSLQQFNMKPRSEMTPNSSQSQLAQVQVWNEARRQELEATTRSARRIYGKVWK